MTALDAAADAHNALLHEVAAAYEPTLGTAWLARRDAWAPADRQRYGESCEALRRTIDAFYGRRAWAGA